MRAQQLDERRVLEARVPDLQHVPQGAVGVGGRPGAVVQPLVVLGGQLRRRGRACAAGGRRTRRAGRGGTRGSAAAATGPGPASGPSASTPLAKKFATGTRTSASFFRCVTNRGPLTENTKSSGVSAAQATVALRPLQRVERAVDLDRREPPGGVLELAALRQAGGVEHRAPRRVAPAGDPGADGHRASVSVVPARAGRGRTWWRRDSAQPRPRRGSPVSGAAHSGGRDHRAGRRADGLTSVYRPRDRVDVRLTLGPLRRGGGDPAWWFAPDGPSGRRPRRRTVPRRATWSSAATGSTSPRGVRERSVRWPTSPTCSGPRRPARVRRVAAPGGPRRVPQSDGACGSRGRATCSSRWCPPSSSSGCVGLDAKAAWRRLVLQHGTPAPGPAPRTLRVPPTAARWREVPVWDWRRAGVEEARAGTVRRAAEVARPAPGGRGPPARGGAATAAHRARASARGPSRRSRRARWATPTPCPWATTTWRTWWAGR